MRIECTSSADYVQDWGRREAIREFAQNWRDACVKSESPGEFKFRSRTRSLYIASALVMGREAILSGYSTKRGDDEQLGQHGEGFGLGCLAAVRSGLKVTITTGAEVWRPALEDSLQFPGQKVLVFTIRQLPKEREGTEILIEGLTEDDWVEVQKMLLFLNPPAEKDKFDTYYGKVLTNPELRGRIFVGGIMVTEMKDLRYGYDFRPKVVRLDRDRRMVNHWEIQSLVGSMNREILPHLAKKEGVEIGDLTLRTIVDPAHETESNALSDSLYTEEDKKAVASAWIRRYGDKAIPSSGDGDKEKFSGGIPIQVPAAAKRAIMRALGGEEAVRLKLESQVLSTYTEDQLDPHEVQHLHLARRALQLSGANIGATEVEVVTFNDDRLCGCTVPVSRKILLARKMLRSFGDAVETMAHELAHIDTAGAADGSPAHTQHLEELLVKIFNVIINPEWRS